MLLILSEAHRFAKTTLATTQLRRRLKDLENTERFSLLHYYAFGKGWAPHYRCSSARKGAV